MYTIFHATAEVVRDSDGAVVAPAQSTDDADYVAYIEWVNAGNEPAVGATEVNEKVYAVTPRQLRLALTATGLRAAVEAAVAGGDQNTKDTWEFSTECLRDNPLLVQMGAALGKTEAELDALFALAATL